MGSASDWIRYFQRVKLTDTEPELAFDEIATGVGFEPTKPKPVNIRDDDGRAWTFRPDRLVDDVYIEILGPYHFTPRQEAKTKWRSELIVKRTQKRLLLIDSPLLTDRTYHTYVAQELMKFVHGRERWKRLYS